MTVLVHGESRPALVDWSAIVPYADWMSDAACAQASPELMYPDRKDSTAPAKRLCQLCPVTPTCLAYALDNDEPYGVWGGLSAAERGDMRRGKKS